MTNYLIVAADAVGKVVGPSLVVALSGFDRAAIFSDDADALMVDWSDVLVLIPASFDRVKDNRWLQSAVDVGKKIVIFSDTWMCAGRVDKRFIPHVDLLTVAFADEGSYAQVLGYKRVCHILPPHWGDMYSVMVAVPPDPEPFIYINGVKDSALNNRVINAVVNAVEHVVVPVKIGFRAHPSEVLDDKSVSMRRKFLNERAVNCSNGVNSIYPARAAVTIFSGSSTDSIIAAYARRPAVYYTDPESRERNRCQGSPDGSWVTEGTGAISVSTVSALELAIKTLLHPDGVKELRCIQEVHFPLPTTWETMGTLAERIRSL